ncbi:uncharacterized protein OCT59_029924 [Rhizophagus irregularis]|uniref:uncharacterized protein n=1 Tax=Rhizophagus irregularis TaxID=588596 RepID=UPI0033267DEC|nr:hypothetical protein OCT59_029924 [Rhizophagus irregularis]
MSQNKESKKFSTFTCFVRSEVKIFNVIIDRDLTVSDLEAKIKTDRPDLEEINIELYRKDFFQENNVLINTVNSDKPEKRQGVWMDPQKKISQCFSLGEEDFASPFPLEEVLSLEEALSCIPPPITYSPDCTKSKTTTKVNGDPPTSVQLWGDFFDKVNQFRFDQQLIFERPQFSQDREVDNEEDVRDALNSNICLVLNRLMGSEYKFSRRLPNTPGVPDFTCHLVGSLILVIEAKRKHVLEDMGEQTFPEFYNTTLDLKNLSLESESPPVLKAYAYLTRQAKENPNSPKPQVLVPAQGDNNSRTLRSNSKSSSSSSLTNQASSTFSNQQSSSNVPVNQQKFSFADFKFKSILGEGRSGKTLLCKFRGETIALKSVDLSKAPSYVLEEMQKEVEMYKDLADIQGKYIPKLVCYGYYGGGMSFVIGLTIVGSMLSDQKITEQQKARAIKGLEAIHKHGILHNDIREENILINDKGALYLIDFGMASREDTKKKRKLFEEEQLKLSQLLDGYIVHFVKKEGRISKSRKCQVVS